MIILIVVIVLIVVGIYHYFPLIQVIGDSMYPTYKEGEIILGTRLYKKSNLKAGDVVLFRCNYDDNRIVIKRIDHIVKKGDEPKLFYFLGVLQLTCLYHFQNDYRAITEQSVEHQWY